MFKWLVSKYVYFQDMASCNNKGKMGNKDSTSKNDKIVIFYALTPKCTSNPINTYIEENMPTSKTCICNNAFVAWVIMIIHIFQHIYNSTLETT